MGSRLNAAVGLYEESASVVIVWKHGSLGNQKSLIFGATFYTTQIDTWSAGCVITEMLLGHPLFPGESGVDQLVEIIKVLGTPTREQLMAMNPNYTEFKFPQIKPHPWNKVFRSRTSQDAL